MTLEAPVETLDKTICYRALKTRDARFDGRFYTAVVTTGIYCRPICPARTPKLQNCLFLPSAAAAHQLGFRPCLRCRPEVAPGLLGFRGTRSSVSRALSLIAEGAWDGEGIEALASRVGLGGRHLRRLFDRHVGATPVSVVQTHRILFARKLVGETRMPMTDVALAAGFGSVRRFNAVFQQTFARAPSTMRRAKIETPTDPSAEIRLSLPFSAPFDHRASFEFLAVRAIPGVEIVTADTYARTFAIGAARGTVVVRSSAAPSQKPTLRACIRTSDVTALSAVVTRLRRVFDLDCDAHAIDLLLAKSALLRTRVARRPGLRVPGAWDSFELAVRAVLGQQVTVRAATTFAGRIVAAYGEPLDAAQHAQRAQHAPDAPDAQHAQHAQHALEPDDVGAGAALPNRIFPAPLALATADLTSIGLTGARARTLNALAAAIAKHPEILAPKVSLDETVSALTELPGIGPWTAHYIAMRAHGEPDAFPAADLGLLRAVTTSPSERATATQRAKAVSTRPTPAALTAMAEAWRPFRAYAAMRLWMQ